MEIDYILTHPHMALFITIGSFLLAQWFQKKMGGYSLLNPIVISIAIVVIYIVTIDISYNDYLNNVNLIHALLGPATVALAVPLYNQLALIKKSAGAIITAILFAVIISAGVAYGLAYAMEASKDVQLSIMSKSVTTAIAIGIAERIGAEPSLAVFFVFTTGIIGSIIATMLFKIFRITNEKAIGLSLGATCHGLGIARAFQCSEKAGAFAVLGMSLMGIISGIILPVIIIYFIL